jgi:lysozyme family protein
MDLNANDLGGAHLAQDGGIGSGTTADVEHAAKRLDQETEDIGARIAIVRRVLWRCRRCCVHG